MAPGSPDGERDQHKNNSRHAATELPQSGGRTAEKHRRVEHEREISQSKNVSSCSTAPFFIVNLVDKK
jgi:hypothetical protein